jgi:DNA (cytosine-5)-methyltransferase 1
LTKTPSELRPSGIEPLYVPRDPDRISSLTVPAPHGWCGVQRGGAESPEKWSAATDTVREVAERPNGTRTARADPLRRPQVAHHRGLPVRPRAESGKPQATDLNAVREFFSKPRSRPTAIDLFCGAGGLSLGLERAGFDVVVGADSDDWAVRTHDANLSGMSWCGDLADPTEFLNTLKVWGLANVDLVAGGVPCQPFSRAGGPRIRDLVLNGERAAHDARADLWSSFVSVVEYLRPAAVLVENVPDLPRWNDGAVLAGLYESLQTLGYRVEARIADGFRHGVPQHRQRLILIAFDGHRPPLWPVPESGLVNLRDAIGDLPPIPRAHRDERLAYDPRRQSSDYQRLMRRDVSDDDAAVIYEHICRDVRPDDMEAYRLLREGETYLDLPMRLRRYRSDVFTDKYKRLAWHELCRSITAHIAKDGYWYIHPDQHRTLSIREAARVQSFPDGFRFAGTQTHRYRQIGNAVPVLLGEAVGRVVLEGLEQPARRRPTGDSEAFRDRLLRWQTTNSHWTPPWRSGADAWLVLLAELVLSRIRSEDADRIFAGLREIASSPELLLAQDSPEIALTNMGIKERAELAVDVAQAIVDRFDGCVPSDEMDLRSLPGVGDYVCRAVLTFAFGRRQVLVDRATTRVALRVACHDDDRRFQVRLDLHRLAGARGPDAEFNQALLDLGRTVCLPERPKCGECPLMTRCATGETAVTQLALAPTVVREEIAA